MSASNGTSHLSDAAILADAARAAGHAPSVHNTQPWRWRVGLDTLDLYAERARQLPVTDPDGRLLHVSCGAALHHARTALAAEGRSAAVALLPDTTNPDHLARITLGAPEPETDAAMRLFQSIAVRHTDRRPVSDTPVGPEAASALTQAAEAEGAHLHRLHRDQVLEVAIAANAAQGAELDDASWREEMAYWAGTAPSDGMGIPADAIPAEPTQTTVPSRDFGHAGTLPIGAGHDRQAVYTILYGDTDDPAGWLCGGQALSRLWLTATELGVTVLPLSGVAEVDHTRAVLTGVLAHLGYPYLVLRLGIADPDVAGAPHTARLPATQVVEIADDAR
jgi:nitroreductase